MGFLESRWVSPADTEDDTARPRRMYRLTMKGIEVLHAELSSKKVKVPPGKRVPV